MEHLGTCRTPYESVMLVQGEFKPHVFQGSLQTLILVALPSCPWNWVIFKVLSHPSKV